MRKSDKEKEREKSKPVSGHHKGEKTEKSSFGKKVKEKLSPEDLHRLDEIRRSFKLGKGKKDKQKLPSGIIADYSENFVQPMLSPDYSSNVSHSDSSESNLSSASGGTTLPRDSSGTLPGPGKFKN